MQNENFGKYLRACSALKQTPIFNSDGGWVGATGEFNGMIAGTAWGAFNALTERIDWYRSARGGSNESILAGASGFDPVITAEKNKIKKAILELTA